MPQDALDLDDLIRRVDSDRWLSSRFIADPVRRADVIALYAFDHEVARAPRVASNPLLGEIRLAWWREVLDEIFEGRAVRRHPTAEALAETVIRHGLAREPLEEMIDARVRDLDPESMTPEEALAWANATGGAAATLAASILDPACDPEAARQAGAAWALARRSDARNFTDVVAGLLAERRDARLTPAAFPAVAHAALASARAGGRTLSDLGMRLRLAWSVARGRV